MSKKELFEKFELLTQVSRAHDCEQEAIRLCAEMIGDMLDVIDTQYERIKFLTERNEQISAKLRKQGTYISQHWDKLEEIENRLGEDWR